MPAGLGGAASEGVLGISLRLWHSKEYVGWGPEQLLHLGWMFDLHILGLWFSPQEGQTWMRVVHSEERWPIFLQREQYFGVGSGMWYGSHG